MLVWNKISIEDLFWVRLPSSGLSLLSPGCIVLCTIATIFGGSYICMFMRRLLENVIRFGCSVGICPGIYSNKVCIVYLKFYILIHLLLL